MRLWRTVKGTCVALCVKKPKENRARVPEIRVGDTSALCLRGQHAQRIFWGDAAPHLEVQVRPAGTSRGADVTQ